MSDCKKAVTTERAQKHANNKRERRENKKPDGFLLSLFLDDPTAGSPTVALLRLVGVPHRLVYGPLKERTEDLALSDKFTRRHVTTNDGRCVQRAGT